MSKKTHHVLTVKPTVSLSAYAAGDLIGGALTLASAVRAAGHAGVIKSVVIADDAGQAKDLDVVFFTASPANSTLTDNAAANLDEADLENVVGVVKVTSWSSFTTAVGTANNLNLVFDLPSGTALYAVIVSRGTPDFVAVDDLTLKVGVQWD